MNHVLNRKLLIGLGFVLFCVNVICRLTDKVDYTMKGPGSLRLIDILGSEEILSTPFKAIEHRFYSIKEELTGKLNPMSTALEDRPKAFAMTTRSSILGFSDKAKPEDMNVSLNNRELNFWTETDSSDVRWSWIDTQCQPDIRFHKNYNPAFKCLILEEDKAFEFDTYFPDAAVTIEITARRNWHPSELDIFVGGRLCASKTVKRRYQTYAASLHIPSGIHTVSLKPRISNRLQTQEKPTPPRVLINEVRICSRNDLILFFAPPEKEAELMKGKVRIAYLSDRLASGEVHPNLELYRIKHNPAFDLGDQDQNPHRVKKKIPLEDLSLDVLMAPPKSQFSFDVQIPSDGVLKFGIGIFKTDGAVEGKSVKFAIDCLRKNQQNRLYETDFAADARPLRDQLIVERVDLGHLAGKRVTLVFSTAQETPEKVVPAFWINPVIIQPAPQNPKIILISLDTLRADHLGCCGYGRNTSPNLDALAKDGVVLTHTYAQSSWTLPSHVSLLYSLNSASHQVYYADQKIDTSLPSLAEFLKNNGYQTYAMTSGGYVSRIFGFDDGFNWYDEPLDKSKDPLGQFEAETLCEYTSEWLKKNKDEQFFLFLHTYQPHGPYYCPSPWNEQFLEDDAQWHKMDLTQFWASRGKDYAFHSAEIANIVSLYDGEIRYTDEKLIKPLINLLKAMNIYDETLICVTSDHGEEFYEHKGWLHGRTLYDESIRVPLIMKFPRSQFKETRIKTKCRLIDIMPTILDIASIEYDPHLIEGKSLMPMILGKEKDHRSFISDLAHQDVPAPCPALIASNRNDLKAIITKSKKEGIQNIEVYDLQKDPGEQSDTVQDHGKAIRDFVKMIDAYYRDKRKISRNIKSIQMDKKQKEKLRALGYIH